MDLFVLRKYQTNKMFSFLNERKRLRPVLPVHELISSFSCKHERKNKKIALLNLRQSEHGLQKRA
jgi:hypothetical protein